MSVMKVAVTKNMTEVTLITLYQSRNKDKLAYDKQSVEDTGMSEQAKPDGKKIEIEGEQKKRTKQ
eukprot:8671292-Ditylum_brightwellii.AAC.1